MVQVVIWGSLSELAGGEKEIEVEAANIRELLSRLGEAHPGLKPQLERGVSVSINGDIYLEDWFRPIPPDAEVYILPKLEGG